MKNRLLQFLLNKRVNAPSEKGYDLYLIKFIGKKKHRKKEVFNLINLLMVKLFFIVYRLLEKRNR